MRRFVYSRTALALLVTLVVLLSATFVFAHVPTLPAQDGDGPPADDIIYIVERGDTLELIARDFNVSLEAIFVANGFDRSTVLFLDDEVIIPGGAPPFGVTPATDFFRDASVEPFLNGLESEAELEALGLGAGGGGGFIPGVDGPGSGEETYVVQTGDLLDLIALSFDVRLTCLAERNGLADDYTIFPGDVIIVPSDCPAYNGPSFIPADIVPLRGDADIAADPVTPRGDLGSGGGSGNIIDTLSTLPEPAMEMDAEMAESEMEEAMEAEAEMDTMEEAMPEEEAMDEDMTDDEAMAEMDEVAAEDEDLGEGGVDAITNIIDALGGDDEE